MNWFLSITIRIVCVTIVALGLFCLTRVIDPMIVACVVAADLGFQLEANR